MNGSGNWTAWHPNFAKPLECFLHVFSGLYLFFTSSLRDCPGGAPPLPLGQSTLGNSEATYGSHLRPPFRPPASPKGEKRPKGEKNETYEQSGGAPHTRASRYHLVPPVCWLCALSLDHYTPPEKPLEGPAEKGVNLKRSQLFRSGELGAETPHADAQERAAPK